MSSIRYSPMHAQTAEVSVVMPDGGTVKVNLAYVMMHLDQKTQGNLGPVETTVTLTGIRTGLKIVKPEPAHPNASFVTKEQMRYQQGMPEPVAAPAPTPTAPSEPRDLDSIRSL